MNELAVKELSVVSDRRTILDGVSFTATGGQVVALVGPNGAGKTTLLDALAGLRPSNGAVRFAGAPLRTFRDRARTIALVPDEAKLAEEVTVETLLATHQADPARRMQEIERYALGALLRRSGRELSRGEAKRVWLAIAALLERPLVLLDEPFGVFDPLQLDDIVPAVRASLAPRGVILVTIHQMDIAERVADAIVILAAGRVVAQGTLSELRAEVDLPDARLDDVFRAHLARARRADAPA